LTTTLPPSLSTTYQHPSGKKRHILPADEASATTTVEVPITIPSMTPPDIPKVTPTITITEATEGKCDDDGLLEPAITPVVESIPIPPKVHERVSEERQVHVTRHGRVICPPLRFQDHVRNQALQHTDQGKETWEEDTDHVQHEIPHMPTFDEGPCDHLLAMKAVSDPDTMYLHQAMKENDWPKFKEAMQKEVNDHSKSKNW
jgi:hypothetical protein